MNELTVKVNEFTLPTIKWNEEELRKEVESIVAPYRGLVLTEEDVAQAKKVKAELNNVVKDLNERKKQVKKTWNKEYTEFENGIKAIMDIVKTESDNIKEQLDVFTEQEKQAKREEVEALEEYQAVQDYIEFNDKWLNKSTTIKSIQEELIAHADKVDAEIKTITLTAANISLEPDKYIEMLKKDSYNELQPIIERMYEDYELVNTKEEPTPEPPKVETNAKVYSIVRELKGTAEQFRQLKAYADKIGVEIKEMK